MFCSYFSPTVLRFCILTGGTVCSGISLHFYWVLEQIFAGPPPFPFVQGCLCCVGIVITLDHFVQECVLMYMRLLKTDSNKSLNSRYQYYSSGIASLTTTTSTDDKSTGITTRSVLKKKKEGRPQHTRTRGCRGSTASLRTPGQDAYGSFAASWRRPRVPFCSESEWPRIRRAAAACKSSTCAGVFV